MTQEELDRVYDRIVRGDGQRIAGWLLEHDEDRQILHRSEPAQTWQRYSKRGKWHLVPEIGA